MGQTDIKGRRTLIDQILIDFAGGTHGNFLEYLLNKFYYSEDWSPPFTDIGTSYNKEYNPPDKKFFAGHFAREENPDRELFSEYVNRSQKVIMITYESTELLQMALNSIYRAGDSKIDIDNLENNTYNKLMKFNFYHELMETLNKSYNLQCSEVNPDVPRYILREFFKFAFKYDMINSYITSQNSAEKFLQNKDVFKFPYKSFFDFDLLVVELNKIAEYYNLTLAIDQIYLKQIHNTFLNRIIGLSDTAICDTIINNINDNIDINIPKLNLFQESYINGKLEKLFNKEMPFKMDIYFTNTRQIIDYLNR